MSYSRSTTRIKKIKIIYDYALAFLAFLLPLIVKGFPLIITTVSSIGIGYYFMAYKTLGKHEKDYYLLTWNLLRDGFLKIFKEKNAMFYMVILFLVYCISVSYSEDLKTAGQKIILKSSYLYFPIIFSLTKWDKKKLIRVLDFFLAGCFFQVVISFFDAYIDAGLTFDSKEFYYTKLSYNLHPSYAALIINIGFIFNTIRIIQLIKARGNFYIVSLRILLLILFLIFILMLSSKAGLVCLVVSLLALSAFTFYRFKSFKTKLIGMLFIVIVLGGGVTFFGDRAVFKFNELISSVKNKNDFISKSAGYYSWKTRLVLWDNTWDVIKESYVFGYGVGDGKKILQNQLKLNEETFVLSKNYNSHNQFLETTLSIGLIGLLLLLIILVKGTFSKKNGFGYISILLGVIIAINFFVESMMEKQIGSITITWLICLLVSAKDTFRATFKYNFKVS